MTRKKHFYFTLILFSLLSYISKAQNNEKLNIIFVVGDGMGLTQVSAYHNYNNLTSSFTRFPYIGISEVSSADKKITDSAAGATAFSCGQKTYNGAIGVGVDGSNILKSIFEYATELDYATGAVATSSITHATPASFYAHQVHRSMEEAIALDLLNSDIDFFAGGGIEFFFHRKDTLNNLSNLNHEVFRLDTTSIDNQDLKPHQRYGFLLASDGMPAAPERGNFLPKVTQLALDYFEQKDKPFFLLVEGSQVDWSGHANDSSYLINEMIDFDQTLTIILNYAETHPNTLVVVTADHETGGLALTSPDDKDYGQLLYQYSTNHHTASLIPVFAYGIHSEKFAGFYPNTGIFDRFLEIIQQ